MATKLKTRVWDSAEHLQDEEAVRLYIEAAQEEAPDDAAFMATVLGDVARARNISELSRSTGIARETLYKVTRGEGNPTLDTISKLANALGFRLGLTPIAAPAKKAASKKKPAKKVVVTVDPAPPLARTQASATVAQVKVVLACLAKSTKPSKVSGLRASIKSWFKPPLDDKAVDAVLQSLQSSKKITVAGTKVAYAIA